MLFPIVCFTCGLPLQQDEEKFYKLVDYYRQEQTKFLSLPSTESMINELKNFFITKKSEKYQDYAYLINEIRTFQDNIITLAEVYKNDPLINQIAETYKYGPEYLAFKEIGIEERRYCCRRMFLCHPRELGSLIL